MSNDQLPAMRLEAVKSLFSEWRANKKENRIPEHLWDAAVSLVDEFSASYVSKQLRIEYPQLKQRYANRATGSFIELSPMPGYPVLRAEIILANGNQMRLYGNEVGSDLIRAFAG